MSQRQIRLLSVVIVLGFATLLGACRRQPPVTPVPPPPPPPTVTPAPPPPPPPPTPTPPPPPPPPAATEAELFAKMSLAELNAQRPLEDVYFDYDKADLSEKWTSTMVTVQGHADSRGTSEYNLALGERRASAVRDYLTTLGVPATRVTVVSMGEEQPTCTEETEGCWEQNRRGHFVITAK
jgi:peptidoglycan-associated lipoprotein